MSVVEQARKLALFKHKDLFRPSVSRQPLTEHLAEVADLARGAGLDDDAVAAAWLHDIVEDTDVTIEDITRLFGAEIAHMVDGLTDPPHYVGLPLEERKQAQADRLASKSETVKAVKLCDQISNVRSVLYDPPTDWLLEKSFLYIQGAKKIAGICHGIVPALDEEFSELYAIAEKKYGDVK